MLILLLVLALQILDLLFSFRDRLEETLKSSLLGRLQVLLQPSSATADSVLTESFLGDEELDQAIDIGGFPFEVAVSMVGGTDIRIEE